jgi:hypothetical protein
MSIPLISRTNTIDEWRVQTNLGATALNNLESGNFTKSNGSLSLTGSSALVITANGTALQVANGALFQSNVTVAGDIALGTQGSATGNLTTGGIVTVLAPGNALQVANNATVNTDLQVTRTIYTGNVFANGNVIVSGNETVSGILRLPGSGDVLYVNSGVAVVKTLSATDVNTTNADISIATINEENVTLSTIVIGKIITGNIVNLTVATSNTDYANISYANVEVSDTIYANVTNTLNVQNGIIKVRADGAGSDGLHVQLGRTVVQDVVIQGNLSVSGSYTQSGETVLQVDTFTLNSDTSINKDANFVNERYIGNNAIINWSETDKIWKVSRGNTYSSLFNILDGNHILTVVTSNSTTNVASASAVKAAYDTGVFAGGYANSAYLHANSAYISQNTTGVYANTAHLHANAAYVSQNTTGVYANSAYNSQNTTGVYANTSYLHANAAYVSQNTTGVYANTAYLHSNAAFTFANTRFASVGGTIAGSVVINGNLTVSGATSYVNTTNMLFADAILTLNADWPATSTPTENVGIEVQRGNQANTVLRWNETTDKWEFTNDGSFYADIAGVYQLQAAGTYANSAYAQANTATTNAATADQRAVTSGSYANSAYAQANTATTNAATADQRAVTSGSYANGAFTRANTAVSDASSANTNANGRVSKSGDTMTGALQVNSTIGATGNITAPFFVGTATTARYADLAEKYTTDEEYSIGTVIVVNTQPNSEATKSTSISQLVLGVISEKPAYLMNSESTGQAIALRGRVPVRVVGPVKKGQTLVSGPDGTASVGEVNRFAIALESKDTHEEGNIEVVIL